MAMQHTPTPGPKHIEVDLEWNGLFSVGYADYALSGDEFFRKLAKKIKELDDPDLDRRGLFFWVSGTEGMEGVEIEDLLFIGSSGREDVSTRIQDRKLMGAYRQMLDEARNRELYFAFAYISFLSTPSEPRGLMFDLERALVFQNQPLCNRHGLHALELEGGFTLTVRNKGDFLPLEESFDSTALESA
jgi:hypothetical protein